MSDEDFAGQVVKWFYSLENVHRLHVINLFTGTEMDKIFLPRTIPGFRETYVLGRFDLFVDDLVKIFEDHPEMKRKFERLMFETI